MKTKINILLGLALASLVFTSCDDAKKQPIANAVYINDAASQTSKKISTDELGGSTTLTARLADFTGSDVTLEWEVNEAFVEEYNKKNGTTYKALPKEYFSLDKTLDTIKAGRINATPAKLSVEPLTALPPSDKYAIAFSIASVKSEGNMPVLEASKSILVILDRVIITNVAHLRSNFIVCKFADALKKANVAAWTAEFLFKPDRVDVNNQGLFMMYPDEVYSRLGDVPIEKSQLQVKTQGQQPATKLQFTTTKWYHVAIVYNGASVRLIVDGSTEVTFPSPTQNFGYKIEEMQFGNTTLQSQVAEVRLWTVARTDSQLDDVKYAVDPKTPGLLVYWKCDEGTGNAIKDYTENGYDATANSSLSWKSGVRFPDSN